MTTLVRALTPADIPAAMRIKEAAGWNQTETDWRNLLKLAPETCFGVECGGVLAATATAVCYGRRLAWIGMVLTDPAHRRRGFARRLLQHAIEMLTARQMEWIKLDATEMGAPLYRQLGFEPECGIQRWGATAGLAPGIPDLTWREQPAVLDRQAFGADRSMREPPGGNRGGSAGLVSGPASAGTCLLGLAAFQFGSGAAGARRRIRPAPPAGAHGAARRARRSATGPRRFANIRHRRL